MSITLSEAIEKGFVGTVTNESEADMSGAINETSNEYPADLIDWINSNYRNFKDFNKAVLKDQGQSVAKEFSKEFDVKVDDILDSILSIGKNDVFESKEIKGRFYTKAELTEKAQYIDKLVKAAGYNGIEDMEDDVRRKFIVDAMKGFKSKLKNEGKKSVFGTNPDGTPKTQAEYDAFWASDAGQKELARSSGSAKKQGKKRRSKFENISESKFRTNGVTYNGRNLEISQLEGDEIKHVQAVSKKFKNITGDDSGLKNRYNKEQFYMDISRKQADDILKELNKLSKTTEYRINESLTKDIKNENMKTKNEKLKAKDLKKGTAYMINKDEVEAYAEFKGEVDGKLCFDNSGEEIKIDPKNLSKYVSEGADCDGDDAKDEGKKAKKEGADCDGDDAKDEGKKAKKEGADCDDDDTKNEATDWGTREISSNNDIYKLVASLFKSSKKFAKKIKTLIGENKFEEQGFKSLFEHVNEVRNEGSAITVSSEEELLDLVKDKCKNEKGFRKAFKKAIKQK